MVFLDCYCGKLSVCQAIYLITMQTASRAVKNLSKVLQYYTYTVYLNPHFQITDHKMFPSIKMHFTHTFPILIIFYLNTFSKAI